MLEIKKILADNEAKLVQPGSLTWMFNQKVSADAPTQGKIDRLFENLDDQDEVEDVVSNLTNG